MHNTAETKNDLPEKPEPGSSLDEHPKFEALLDLARQNNDDVKQLTKFVSRINDPPVYLNWFRPDEVLCHFRTWEQRLDSNEQFWIRVLQSRRFPTCVKLWLLGEDRVKLSGWFNTLLGEKGINIDAQFGVVSDEHSFSILSLRIKKAALESAFQTSPDDSLRQAIENLGKYLWSGLSNFYCGHENAEVSHCIPVNPSAMMVVGWFNRMHSIRSKANLDNAIDLGPRIFASCDDFSIDHLANELVETDDTRFPTKGESSKTPLFHTLIYSQRFLVPNPRHVLMQGLQTVQEREHSSVVFVPSPNMREGRSQDQCKDLIECERIFKALGDSTRANILRALFAAASDLSVTEIAARIGQEHATTSAALQKLVCAGLVECVRSGKHRQYSARLERLKGQINLALNSIVSGVRALG